MRGKVGLHLAALAAALMAAVAQGDELRSFNIPPGDLARALESLAKETGLELIFQPKELRGIVTQGVQGMLSPQDAVARLIQGTNLTIRTEQGGAMLISAPPPVATGATGAAMLSPQARRETERVRLAQAAFVQDTTPAAPAAPAGNAEPHATGNRIEEVIVTAQKRSESLQDVPLSVQVVTGEVLSDRNLNSLADLAQTVPGVHISTGGQANSIYVRGIGSNENSAFEQSVATFVDDIYRGRSRLSGAAFFDLERVEFLKGPQSTFFGNNAIAGALNIVTRKPGDSLQGEARTLYGNHGNYALEAGYGGPVTDNLGVRVAGTWNGSHRGWMENIDTGERLPIKRNVAARVVLAYEPTDNLDITMKVEGSRSKITGTAFGNPSQYINCAPPAPLPVNSLYRECSRALAQGVPIGLDNDEVAGLPGQFNLLETFDSVLTANYRVAEHTLTAITGYTYYDSDLDYDPANVRNFQNSNQLRESSPQFSQELRIASATGGRLEYLAGLYYQVNDLDSLIHTNGPFLNASLAAGPLGPYLPWSYQRGFNQEDQVISAFGSLSWNVTDRLKLNTGLRGSWVEKDFTGYLVYGTGSELYGGMVPFPGALQLVSPLVGRPGEAFTKGKYDAWMPSAGLQFELLPDVLSYVSYSRGFKAGGFNPLDAAASTVVPNNGAYDPEYVHAYEAGLKSKWLDDSLLINVAVFLSDYEDLQVTTLEFQPLTGTYTASVRNAAKSRSQGVELEMRWAASEALELGANVTYLDAYYESYTNATPTALQRVSGFPVQDLSGEPTDFAPEWSGSLVVRYTAQLSQNYAATFEVTPFFTTDFFTSNATNDPLSEVSGYVYVDARITLAAIGRNWGVDLIGKNLTDKIIPIRNQNSFGQKREPRTGAIQFRYSF
jgi:iron complex outermembrane receptor protein